MNERLNTGCNEYPIFRPVKRENVQQMKDEEIKPNIQPVNERLMTKNKQDTL